MMLTAMLYYLNRDITVFAYLLLILASFAKCKLVYSKSTQLPAAEQYP